MSESVRNLQKSLNKSADARPATLLQRRPAIGRCYHIQTPAGALTICDHSKENSLKSSGAQTIIKFAGDVQIAEIVRLQFFV